MRTSLVSKGILILLAAVIMMIFSSFYSDAAKDEQKNITVVKGSSITVNVPDSKNAWIYKSNSNVQVLKNNSKKYLFKGVSTGKSTVIFYYNNRQIKYNIKIVKSLKKPTFTIKGTTKGIKVDWNKVSNADCYRIYATNSSGRYVKVAEKSKNTTLAYVPVRNGRLMKIKVYAVCGNYVKKSDAKSINYCKPINLSVKNATDGILLSWNDLDGVEGYDVYLIDENGVDQYYKTVKGGTLKYTYKEVKSGEKYSFEVRPFVGERELGSAKGEIVYLQRIELVNDAFDDGRDFQWAEVKGADGYRIYRSEDKGKTFNILAETKLTRYLDTDMECMKKYYYRFVAYKDGYESAVLKDYLFAAKHYKGEIIGTVSATCTEKGHTIYECSRCGESFDSGFHSLPHEFTDWEVNEETGTMSRECTICGTVAEVPYNTGNDIVDLALSYVGGVYLLTGDNLETGIDCSHFVRRMLAETGHYTGLWHFSTEWVNYGIPVEPKDAKAGDIIVFQGHVAIYMGDGLVVHASGAKPYPKGGIRVSNYGSMEALIKKYTNVSEYEFLGIRRFE